MTLLYILILLIIFTTTALIFLKDPFWTIVAFALGSYAGIIGSIGIFSNLSITLFQIFLGISFVAFVFHFSLTKNLELKLLGIEIELLIFLALIFLSIIYSPNRPVGLLDAFRVLVLILMVYLIVNSIDSLNKVKILIYSIIIISTILAVYAMKEGFKTENLVLNLLTMGNKLQGRASINITDPNIFASHFFFPILFLFSSIFTSKIGFKFKIPSTIILPILLGGIASTFSRSAWVSLIFSIFLLAVLKKKIKIFLVLTIIFLIIVFINPSTKLVVENLYQRFLDIFSGVQDDSSRARLVLFYAAIYMAADSYLLGVGFRGYPILFTKYFSKHETIGVVEPHNLFYTIIAELGILGLLLYFWILFIIARTALNNFTLKNSGIIGAINLSLFLSFFCYIIFYQFYGGGLVDNNYWIIIGLIFVMNGISENNVSEK